MIPYAQPLILSRPTDEVSLVPRVSTAGMPRAMKVTLVIAHSLRHIPPLQVHLRHRPGWQTENTRLVQGSGTIGPFVIARETIEHDRLAASRIDKMLKLTAREAEAVIGSCHLLKSALRQKQTLDRGVLR